MESTKIDYRWLNFYNANVHSIMDEDDITRRKKKLCVVNHIEIGKFSKWNDKMWHPIGKISSIKI